MRGRRLLGERLRRRLCDGWHHGRMDVLSALIPPVALFVLFVSLLVTAYRATDGARREQRHAAPDDD